MINGAQIYPDDEVSPESSVEEPKLPITRCSGGKFHWVFRHVGLNQEHVFYGELFLYSNCLAILDDDGEWVAVFPASHYRAYRKENPNAVG